MTVCQLRTASCALVRCLWVCGSVRRKYLEKVAFVIQETQDRNRRSRRSHVKAKLRLLRKFGIKLFELRCCILNE